MANVLESGFQKADSRNLPEVDIFMVYELITKDDRFNAPEVRGAKTMKASRESYGDSAVYIVKAQIFPEHKVRQKQYCVVLCINGKEKISMDIQCIGCNAALEEKTADGFIEFAKQYLDKNLCEVAEKETRTQSDSLLWYELRYGRITASKLYEASKCKTKQGSLVNQIIGAAKLYQSTSMKRGKKLEDEVFQVIKEKGFEIEKSGFILIPNHPIFGASPDAIASDFIVEIKCPSTNTTLKNYLHEGQITQKYKAQMMLQMFAANKNKGLFCVADSEFEKNSKVYTVWIEYDKTFLDTVLEDATKFWKENIYPIFIN